MAVQYAHDFLKVTFGGHIYGDQDEWTCGINIGSETQDFAANGFTWSPAGLAFVKEIITDWFTSTGAGISQHADMRWIKMAIIGKDGKYKTNGVDGPYTMNYVQDFAPVNGGDTLHAGQNVAPQLTVALTMETDVSRGPGKFGRIYPPLTGNPSNIGLDDNPEWKADAFRDMISGLNGAFATLFDINEFGVIVASGKAPGKHARVKRVKVGQVIDTQRRRRNNIPENYTTRDLTF